MMQAKITQKCVAHILKTAAKHLRVLRVDSASAGDLKVLEAWESRIFAFRDVLALKDTGATAASKSFLSHPKTRSAN
jgi:hypothetical protein